MKKIFAVTIMIGIAFSSFAGEPNSDNSSMLNVKKADGEKCYDENTHIINVGVGVGNRGYHTYYRGAGHHYGRTPAINLSYEQPWPKRIGPGYLGVGAYFAFQHEYYNYDYSYGYISTSSGYVYDTYYYKHRWNHYMLGGRAAYHWDVLNSKNAEVYAGVVIGVRIQTSSYETNDPTPGHDPYNYASGAAYPAYSVFAGARWYFAKSVGLFAEVGYGISYANVGMSIKF